MWQLEEDIRVIAVGDEASFSLVLEEVAAESSDEGVETVRGTARPLPVWTDAQGGRHPVRIEIDGGAICWDAPTPIQGPVEVVGRVVSDDEWPYDDDVPATRGMVRRVRMEWCELVLDEPQSWHRTSAPPRYEDVPASYLPKPDSLLGDDDATMPRALEHPQADGRKKGARSFVSLGYPVAPSPEIPLGTTKSIWTGVLLDLEITGLELV